MQSGSHYGNSGDTRLAERAAAQHGVVSTEDLRELGYSKHTIHDRVTHGRLHRIHRGVYAVGHIRISLRGRWLAAVLACGTDAVLSHRDAATLHDLRPVSSGSIDVTATSRHTIDGICCHYARVLHPEDRDIVDSIPVTSVSRTCLDVAETLNGRRLRSALEQAQRQNKFDLRLIQAVIARSPGRRGLKPLAEALAQLIDEPPWTQSELENYLLELIRAAGLPLPRTNVFIDGELVDCAWTEHNLIVEVDGWTFHRTKRSFEDDRRRDAKLVLAGWRVVRFTYDQVRYEPQVVARTLTKLLSAAPSPPAARSGQ
jgi:very-short-patch-repair endonuclease